MGINDFTILAIPDQIKFISLVCAIFPQLINIYQIEIFGIKGKMRMKKIFCHFHFNQLLRFEAICLAKHHLREIKVVGGLLLRSLSCLLLNKCNNLHNLIYHKLYHILYHLDKDHTNLINHMCNEKCYE